MTQRWEVVSRVNFNHSIQKNGSSHLHQNVIHITQKSRLTFQPKSATVLICNVSVLLFDAGEKTHYLI